MVASRAASEESSLVSQVREASLENGLKVQVPPFVGPGEKVRIYNWQDNDPWDSTPIATQTGCAALDVSTTIAPASITQPGFTTDGAGTLFPKPPDLGPQFVVYFMYPDWAGAATPTPTPRPR